MTANNLWLYRCDNCNRNVKYVEAKQGITQAIRWELVHFEEPAYPEVWGGRTWISCDSTLKSSSVAECRALENISYWVVQEVMSTVDYENALEYLSNHGGLSTSPGALAWDKWRRINENRSSSDANS